MEALLDLAPHHSRECPADDLYDKTDRMDFVTRFRQEALHMPHALSSNDPTRVS